VVGDLNTRHFRRSLDLQDQASFGQVLPSTDSSAGVQCLSGTFRRDTKEQTMVDVNLKGSFHALRKAARRVRAGGWVRGQTILANGGIV
jgi:hypothetical protein